MGWLGLTPSESSTGDRVRRGAITKSGNSRARRTLIESAWSYRYPAHVGAAKQIRMQAAPPAVRQIAWKAQTRLTGALSQADQGRQTQHRGRGRDRPRTGGVHLGGRAGLRGLTMQTKPAVARTREPNDRTETQTSLAQRRRRGHG